MFKPEIKADWDGNLKRYELGLNQETQQVELRDAMGVPAVNSATGEIKSTAKSYWSGSVDGDTISEGGAASQLPDPRTLYTTISGSNTTETEGGETTTETTTVRYSLHEDTAEITNTLLGIPGADDGYRAEVLKWSRGVDVKDFDGDGDITEVRTQLGDPMHSTQFIMNYPDASDDVDELSLIFMSTNHGFLHAIDTDSGIEKFGYIPEELLDNLNFYYEDKVVNHDERKYGLDGEITGWHEDTNNNGLVDTTENAFIYVGMRRGGRSYYALDVSDPDDPKLAWKITGSAGGPFAELGQTWSRPIKARIKHTNVIRDVLVFGAGYDESNDNEELRTSDTVGRGFFIVDALTGALISHRDSTDFDDMDYSFPSDLRVIDLNGDSFIDLIFAADTGGQVWRFDVNNDAESDSNFITGAVAADFGGPVASQNRHFFYEPDIALIKNDSGEVYLNVAIGSGSRPNPNGTQKHDTFYSFKDNSIFGPPRDTDDEISYPTALTESDLLNVTETLGSENTTDGALAKGWYIKLPATGEKVLSGVLTLDNELLFTTYIPPSVNTGNICEPNVGKGRVYSLNIFNGDPANGSQVLRDRHQELDTPGIPPKVLALMIEAAPNSITKFVGKEALGNDNKGEPFTRTFWAEQ